MHLQKSWTLTFMFSEPQATRSSSNELALETDHICVVI